MTENQLTLEHLFFGHPGRAARESVEEAPAMVRVRETFSEELPSVSWAAVAGKIDETIGRTLGIEVAGILAGAWKTYDRLRRYSDPVEYPPRDVILAELASHTVRSSHHPAIKVLIGEREVASLEFDIELALDLEAVLLEIQAGRIRGVLAGACTGRASVRSQVRTPAGTAPLPAEEWRTQRYELGGKLDLGEGIEIPTG